MADQVQPELFRLCSSKEDWALVRDVITLTKIKWAIYSFDPYKSAGPDQIIPALLQQGMDSIQSILCSIYRVCLASGYVSQAWRQTKVIFIPKPGRPSYAVAKAYRPISLSSFLSKTLERLVDRHIRDKVLKEFPLHKYQFAYLPGKSTEAALHQVVSSIEKGLAFKEIAIGAFLDVEGAFDKTSCEVILTAFQEHNVPPLICKWIHYMLKSRQITMSLVGETLRVSVAGGCPRGGVLLPLLWDLVVDALFRELNKAGYLAIGYADDIAVIVKGKFPTTVIDMLQVALKNIENWCNRTKLSVNPNKTVLVPFTRMRSVGNLRKPTLFGERIPYSHRLNTLDLF
ncbi:hypothetical protein ANN_28739 [Periplaneta americana]|uniref:Reverse transcriptase domain-containing protein n=1 Tax=Periplaneta americana TaxID=6978 RepID=A0ABQ8TV71_PERAM|nr:hypothetical protein ANN_28739 [Periplaneta americana]